MKELFAGALRFTSLLMLALALAPFARAQQADEDPAPATPHQNQPTVPDQPSSLQDTPTKDHALPANEVQTQDTLTFTGRVVERKGRIVLNDPVTKVVYQFDDQSRVRPYLGKQIKVSGKLDMNSNTIHIASVEPFS